MLHHVQDEDLVPLYGYYPVMAIFTIGAIISAGFTGWSQGFGKKIVLLLGPFRATGRPCESKNKEARENELHNLTNGIKRLCQNYPFLFNYWCSHGLALVSVLAPTFLLYAFFKIDFVNFGFNPALYNEVATVSDKYFPKVCGCVFIQYGPSGTIQILNSICTFNNNILFQRSVNHIFLILLLTSILILVDTFYLFTMTFIIHLRTYKRVDRKTGFLLAILRRNLDEDFWETVYNSLEKVSFEGLA